MITEGEKYYTIQSLYQKSCVNERKGPFDNFLLANNVKERNTCLVQWRNISDKETYENFMIKYKDKWINKAPITKRRYRKHRINRKQVIN